MESDLPHVAEEIKAKLEERLGLEPRD
jgi:hypothetical protein